MRQFPADLINYSAFNGNQILNISSVRATSLDKQYGTSGKSKVLEQPSPKRSRTAEQCSDTSRTKPRSCFEGSATLRLLPLGVPKRAGSAGAAELPAGPAPPCSELRRGTRLDRVLFKEQSSVRRPADFWTLSRKGVGISTNLVKCQMNCFLFLAIFHQSQCFS